MTLSTRKNQNCKWGDPRPSPKLARLGETLGKSFHDCGSVSSLAEKGELDDISGSQSVIHVSSLFRWNKKLKAVNVKKNVK